MEGRRKQGGLRRRKEIITHTDELHIHFGVLFHVLQQVHMEGLSLEEAKEPSPSSLHCMGCYMHCGEGQLIKPAELVTLLPPPHAEARNGHIRHRSIYCTPAIVLAERW